jgi:hypothetical protein
MITSEQVRQALRENNFYIVVDYITQQEKKDKLLALYQYLNENTNDYDLHPDEVDEINNKIYELEEELK